MHSRWALFLQKYRNGKKNVVADAFSRSAHVLPMDKTEILCFDTLKELYGKDADFGQIWFQFLRTNSRRIS